MRQSALATRRWRPLFFGGTERRHPRCRRRRRAPRQQSGTDVPNTALLKKFEAMEQRIKTLEGKLKEKEAKRKIQ